MLTDEKKTNEQTVWLLHVQCTFQISKQIKAFFVESLLTCTDYHLNIYFLSPMANFFSHVVSKTKQKQQTMMSFLSIAEKSP